MTNAIVYMVMLFVVVGVASQRRVGATTAGPVELNPSILVLGRFDTVPYQAAPGDKLSRWTIQNGYTSRCTDMVDRALQRAGGTILPWVPTVYWVSSAPDKSDVQGYCIMDGTDGTTTCRPVTQALIDDFTAGLRLCMQLASDKGVNELAVIPHLDEATRLSAAWRNAIVFSPTKQYAVFSYVDVLLNPIADALGAVAKPWTIVHFALQGEMSATVMRYPKQWQGLIDHVRQRIIAAAAKAGVTLPPNQTNIGLSFNYNKVELGGLRKPVGVPPLVVSAAGPADKTTVAGRRRDLKQQITLVDGLAPSIEITRQAVVIAGPPAPAATVKQPAAASIAVITPSRPESSVPGVLDAAAVQALLAACNFIGISAYAPLNAVNFNVNALQNSVFTFYREFQQTSGVDALAIMQLYGIALHYSEFGVGGGTSMDGETPATTALEAANNPFFGVYPKLYTSRLDPWRNPVVRSFMISFWRKALSWLAQGGGPTYPITKCFMWTLGSYDVLAIYTESTSPSGGTYFTTEVSQAILAHNAQTAAANQAAVLAGRRPWP